ncbi:hypothetical protein MKD50_20205 [Cupriavidus sp. WGtm5]|uniref:hypothetical protein n=1 Tax=Cupriavidus sp. WGtm5 TaxID=2919926 RepID=UPI002090F062|nr:hypothetical protein [Cupriavidus sp. WGtm5]MCO4891711.1 hypothetical protein [Cupriavidus sp. WGtm5]
MHDQDSRIRVIQLSHVAGIALGGWGTQALGLQSTYFLVAAAYAVAVVPMLAARVHVPARVVSVHPAERG